MVHEEQGRQTSSKGGATVDDRSQPDPGQRDDMVTKKERTVAKTIAPFILVALIIATLVMSFLTRRWEFLLAMLVFVPYLFLLTSPIWLAGASKAAKDVERKERR